MRKAFILMVFLFSLTILGSCKQKEVEPTEITREEILSFEGSYYVYFYGEDCPACIETTAKIKELMKKHKITCYFFNTDINPIGITDDPAYKNIGVYAIKNIKIRVTPTLLFIEDKVVSNQYSGRVEIMDHLK